MIGFLITNSKLWPKNRLLSWDVKHCALAAGRKTVGKFIYNYMYQNSNVPRINPLGIDSSNMACHITSASSGILYCISCASSAVNGCIVYGLGISSSNIFFSESMFL